MSQIAETISLSIPYRDGSYEDETCLITDFSTLPFNKNGEANEENTTYQPRYLTQQVHMYASTHQPKYPSWSTDDLVKGIQQLKQFDS